MITGELKNQVDKVWDTFWTEGISNPLTVIEQFTYLLFIRRLDEVQLLKENKANVTGEPIEDPIYTKEQKSLRWKNFKDCDPQIMFDLFTRPQKQGQEEEIPTVFEHMKEVGSKVGIFA